MRLHKIALFVYIGVEVVTFLVQIRRATGQNIVLLLFSEHFYVNVEIVTTRKWRASLRKSFLLASFQLISFFHFIFVYPSYSVTCMPVCIVSMRKRFSFAMDQKCFGAFYVISRHI